MAKKLNSLPDYQARIPKHPHDVSQSTAFTCAPGMLLPVYHDMLHAGDEIHYSASEFVRFNPLEAQPLGEVDVHLDFFFVPLTVMYLPTSSMFYQTDDLVSSVFSRASLNSLQFPVLDIPTGFRDLKTNDVVDDDAPFCSYPQQSSLVDWLPKESFDCIGKSIYRLMDLLDMNPQVLLDTLNEDPVDYYPEFTPWFALAYQAIYQLYYRNDDREPKNYHYNIDDKYANNSWSETFNGNTKSILQINYASRPKDYFNSIKVSPLSSSASLLSASALQTLYGQVNEWLDSTSATIVNAAGNNANLGPDSTSVRGGFSTGATSYVPSTAKVRNMFMVEKLLRVIGRSEKNYESQFLAHYGIKIPHDVMHNITHLGHDMITIRPEAVISQADTYNASADTGSALGEIGGQGSGMLSGKKRNFKAPFHGVFMCISHVIPRRRYVLGLSKLHQLSHPSDFWQPEFDEKGMQPLFGFECFRDLSTDPRLRMGWQFGYEQFKRKSDRVTTAFAPVRLSGVNVNTYSPWVISGYPYGFIKYDGSYDVDIQNSPAPWRMLVAPTEMNINMQVFYDPRWSSDFLGSPHLIYHTDPFICDFNMYCKKVNGMSEYSEPEL